MHEYFVQHDIKGQKIYMSNHIWCSPTAIEWYSLRMFHNFAHIYEGIKQTFCSCFHVKKWHKVRNYKKNCQYVIAFTQIHELNPGNHRYWLVWNFVKATCIDSFNLHKNNAVLNIGKGLTSLVLWRKLLYICYIASLYM